MSKKKDVFSENTTADITQQLFNGSSTNGAVIEKNGMRRCLGCMEEYPSEYEICPECGYSMNEEIENALHMFPGTILHDKYIIGKVIGYGGFGVTYLAWDTVLRIKVAIKEYLPSEFSTRAMGQTQVTVFSGDKTKQFNDGLTKFVDEAKRLAKFRNEDGIVKIFDSFNENNTAYIAMEYLQGETLAERLEREKTIPVDEAIQMLMPIIESLNRVHDEGIIHRDIAPDNIFITNDGKVKLIDFGAARYATTSRSRSLTVIIKPGYSAEEQYRSRGDQGPHTDVYSVGACIYRMITGIAPPDAMERRAQFEKNRHDMLKPIRKFVKDIDPRRENAIYNALNVRIEDRTPDMISLVGELTSEEPVKRRRSGIKKIDPLTWPLWAKIGVPAGLAGVVTLSVLLIFGVIGPKDHFGQYVPDGMTVVPDIINIPEDKAEKKLEKYDLDPVKGEKFESDYFERGRILGQDPDALNVVLPKSQVTMLLSDGFGDGVVPEVIGFQKELAEEEVKNAGFKVEFKEVELGSKEYLKITDTEYADGVICGQDPKANSLAERVNTTVTLYVSVVKLGTADKKVPDVTGKSFDEAQKLLKSAGLLVGTVSYEYNAAIPENQVIGQYPLAGDVLKENSGVSLTVNKGAEKVVVPDLTRMSSDAAQLKAENLGLLVNLKGEENEDYEEGIVFRQSIAKGKQVEKGTTVTLTFATKKSVNVPNVVGMAEKKAQSTLEDAGFVVSIRYEKSDKDKGTVLSQDPASGKADYKSTVYLVVSSGSDEPVNNDDPQSNSLISIQITTQPNKTEYLIGESFSKDGMKVVARYGNGSEKDVTNSVTLSQTGAFTSAGQQMITVSYSENGLTKTDTVRVTVLEPSISLDKTSITISVGKTEAVRATVSNASSGISWSSNNTSVAAVDSSGNVRGVSAGETYVTASVTVGGKTLKANCQVRVISGDIPATDLKIDSTSLTKYLGDTFTLHATQTPSNATTSVSWSSSNGNVASVDNGGNVTCKAAGNATITARTTNGKTATCSLTVKEPASKNITYVKLKNSNKRYYPGADFTASEIEYITVEFDNGSRNVSSGFTITLDPNVTYGDRPVTVSYTSGGKTAKTVIKVKYDTVTIYGIESSYTLEADAHITLTPTINPSGSGLKIECQSNNANVASVSNQNNTITIYAKNAGTTTIDMWIAGYKESTKKSVTVKVNNPDNKTLQSISVKKGPNKSSGYYVGDTLDPTGIVITKHFSDGSKDDISSGFSLSDDKITGTTTTFTVTYADKSATFSVSATTPTITLSNPEAFTEKVDGTNYGRYRVTCSTKPEGVTVSWSYEGLRYLRNEGNNTVVLAQAYGASQGKVVAKFKYGYNNQEYPAEVVFNMDTSHIVDHVEWDVDAAKKTYVVGDYFSGDPSVEVHVYYKNESGFKTFTESFLNFSVSQFTSVGTVPITVTWQSGYSTTYYVTVTAPSVSISMNKTKLEFNEPENRQESTTATANVPDDGAKYSYLWSVEGSFVALTPNDKKQCTVTANRNTENGPSIVKCEIKRNDVPVGTPTIKVETTVVKLKSISCSPTSIKLDKAYSQYSSEEEILNEVRSKLTITAIYSNGTETSEKPIDKSLCNIKFGLDRYVVEVWYSDQKAEVYVEYQPEPT